jgi:hypothetical protein
MSHASTTADLARDYLARGWCPVPVPYRKKRPVLDAWQTLRPTPDALPRLFPGTSNVGIILGEPSHGLADVDLDCLEAIELAPSLLPPTATFGRQSKPASHWLFHAPGSTTRQYKAFGETLVELRSGTGGHQTVFPGSVHECGERIEWTDPGATTPSDTPAAELSQRVAHLAVACLLMRHAADRLSGYLAAPATLPAGLPDAVRALAAEWLGLGAAKPAKPTAPPTRALERFEEARRAFCLDTPLEATKRGRACPADGCEGKNSFKGDGSKATCFHSSHPHTCGTRCAGSGSDLFVFDALDLAAHNAGRTPREHLEAAGYWRPLVREEPPPPSDRDAPARVPGEDDGPAGRDVLRDGPAERRGPVVAIGDAVDGAIDLFRRRHDGTEKPMPLPWPGVAQALGGGLWPGAHVLTGTTAAGKTAFAIQCAISTAAAGHPVLYIGLELDTAQIVARLASLLLGEHEGRPVAHWSDIYLGKVAPPEEAIREVAGLPLYVEEAPPGGWSARAMDARVKDLRLKHPGKTPLVVLDFLQLVGPSEPGGRREELRERIGAAAYAGRQVARAHGAVVLMLSSISRAGATELLKMGSEDSLGSGDPAELVGLGKESGDIEFAADSVLCLAREPRDENEPKGPATIWLAIAKQRAGSPTWCCLKFNGSWHEEDRSATPATRRDDRARAKAKELEDRRQRDFERRLGNVIKVLEAAKDRGPLSVHYVCSKVGARPSGFVAYLQELEQRGLAHQVWFGRKSLGWAIGSGPNDAFPSVPISSGNASERTGTVCVPTAPCNGQGTHPASAPERPAEQKPPPLPRVRMTPDERAALIARAAQPDEYLEAMAARPADHEEEP